MFFLPISSESRWWFLHIVFPNNFFNFFKFPPRCLFKRPANRLQRFRGHAKVFTRFKTGFLRLPCKEKSTEDKTRWCSASLLLPFLLLLLLLLLSFFCLIIYAIIRDSKIQRCGKVKIGENEKLQNVNGGEKCAQNWNQVRPPPNLVRKKPKIWVALREKIHGYFVWNCTRLKPELVTYFQVPDQKLGLF